MPKAILYRIDDCNSQSKSCVVYRNLESALRRIAQAQGRDLRPNFDPHVSRPSRTGTVYKSNSCVIAIGSEAHERLNNVVRRSVIYLNPSTAKISDAPDVARLLSCVGPCGVRSSISLLGQRAKQASIFLPQGRASVRDLPPLDLSGSIKPSGSSPRLTIVNHLKQDRLARTIIGRLMESSTLSIDGIGLHGDARNRVRYLADDEVSDLASDIHIHVGAPRASSERLRICDSWQSRTPVLYFNADDAGEQQDIPHDLRDEGNVLICNSYSKTYEFLTLLLETPSLYRLLVDGGRASVAPAAQCWDGLVQELAA